jgi:hypothetical protein
MKSMDLVQSIKDRIEKLTKAQAELAREIYQSGNKRPAQVKIDLKDYRIIKNQIEKMKLELWEKNGKQGNIDDYEQRSIEELSYWLIAENRIRSSLTDVFEGKEVSKRELMEIGLQMRNELIGIQVRTNFPWLFEGLNKPTDYSEAIRTNNEAIRLNKEFLARLERTEAKVNQTLIEFAEELRRKDPSLSPTEALSKARLIRLGFTGDLK